MNYNSFKKEEFIGRYVTIINCPDPTWIGRSGKIIDETKNTLLIEFGIIKKRIAKQNTEFEFKLKNKKLIISGSKIMFRCEDRIKKAR